MKPTIFKIFLFILFFIPPSLFASEPSIPVIVSILPQVYFVERIGGNRVDVDVLVLPGKNPATYAPTPTQISNIAKSKIFFRIGVPFESALMPKIQRLTKRLKIVDTHKGIQFRKMKSQHHHDNEGHHDDGNDPHIWLSPLLVKKQANTILEALMELDPAGKATYKNNYDLFIKDLDLLHLRIQKTLATLNGETIFVYHPAFGYFAETYGLEQMAVEIEGKAPKGKALANFIKKAKINNVHAVFVQLQFDRNAAKQVAKAINGAVVPLDPLSRDYIHNLEDMAIKVSEALQK